MINKLKSLFSKPAKKSHEENLVGYFGIGLDKSDHAIVAGDFADDSDDAISKILFLIFSGVITEHLVSIITEKCNNDTERVNKIMVNTQTMLYNYMQESEPPDEEEEYDDDEPIVDPCDVFRPRRDSVDEESDVE